MTEMVINIKGRLPCVEHDRPSGIVGTIGWSRLAESLQISGDVKSNETVTHFIATAYGLQFFVTQK